MDKNKLLMQIRMKKLAIMISDARRVSRRSGEECAAVMGASTGEFQSFERGKAAPSLPQLEALAFYLDVPVEHFWGNQVLNENKAMLDSTANLTLRRLRDRYLGTRLRQLRTEAAITPEELAEKTSLSTEKIEQYESGRAPIPLPDLESIVRALNTRVEDVFDKSGPIGDWRTQKEAMRSFLDLSQRHQQFVSKPVNIPYIELAIRLSDLSVERLRAIAEGILEITF
jgi:transcriptional regulator with XRE-family HTH domain